MYLSMLIRAYSPNQYERLIEQRLRVFLAFLGMLIGVTAIVFSIVVVALTIGYVGGLPEILAPVHELRLSGNVTADAPVVLLERPTVVLDMTVNGTETAAARDPDLIFTQGGVVYPRYVYGGASFIAWSEMTDLKQQSPLRDRLLGGIVLFLAPSLVFWGLVYHLGRVLLIALVLWAFGYWVPRAFRHRIGGLTSCKLLILTLPSVLIFGVGLSPLAPGPLFWWGLILTIMLYTLGVLMLSERITADWMERRRDRKA